MHLQPSYKTQPKRDPSVFNREALLGGVAGFALIGLGSAFIPLGVPLALLGAGIGGFAGRQRMARESKTGVIAKPPTFWNIGLAIGLAAGLIAAPLAATMFLWAGAGLGGLIGLSTLGAGYLGNTCAALGALGALGSMGFLGAQAHEKQMQADYSWARINGTVVEETRPPSPLDIPKNAPAVPAMSPRTFAEFQAQVEAEPPPQDYGKDAQKLRGFLDKEMSRRIMPQTQYPFNNR